MCVLGVWREREDTMGRRDENTSKKKDLWGRFSGRMSTSSRTGFLPQGNTPPHPPPIHTPYPCPHHAPTHPIYPLHTTCTHYTPPPTHTLSFRFFLSQPGGPQTGLAHVPFLPSLTEEDKGPAALFPHTLLPRSPSRPSASPALPLVRVWALLPCFLRTFFKAVCTLTT